MGEGEERGKRERERTMDRRKGKLYNERHQERWIEEKDRRRERYMYMYR